jgi:hypothetical protein
MGTWILDQPLMGWLWDVPRMNLRPRNGDGKISQDELKMVLHNSEAQ